MFYSYITFYYIIIYLARFIWKNHACTYRRIIPAHIEESDLHNIRIGS